MKRDATACTLPIILNDNIREVRAWFGLCFETISIELRDTNGY